MNDGGRRLQLRHVCLLGGAGGALLAGLASPAAARAASGQTWAPFALVTGLLMIGVVAHADGVFTGIAALTERVRIRPASLLLLLLGLVAVVTAVLNLDTSVAFLTPVLVLAARARGLDEEPFLYGTLLMSNAASLLLPGSNLTNLIVLASDHVTGAVFAARMLPAWVASVAITAAFVSLVYRRQLKGTGPSRSARVSGPRLSSGAAAIAVAMMLLLVLPSPALPVLAVAGLVTAAAVQRSAVTFGAVWDAVDPATLVGVFGIAVALGTLARTWSGPAHLMATAGRAETAAVGAVASIVVNNLPAAVLLASRRPPHPRALLLGLNLGPNLAATGSLSALIWYRAAKAVGATPSVVRLTQLGVFVVPLTIVAGTLLL